MTVSVMRVRNVCEALLGGVAFILNDGRRERSRGGDVLVLPGPMITETSNPTERVLFSAVRDANPFFHVAEAIWMLSGSNDAKFLDRFVSDFSEKFAETGGVLHGAYGHRWRRHFLFDQLNHVVEMLRTDPTTRQAVVSMWDPSETTVPVDYGNGNVGEEQIGGFDLTGFWKDRPCNTHLYLRVRHEHHLGAVDQGAPSDWISFLDMTVCCRSNDAIWGAHGANAVHFSVLLEYLAARIGLQVGTLVQVSNNYHAYEAFIQVMQARARKLGFTAFIEAMYDDRYAMAEVRSQPMFSDPGHVDEDVGKFMRWMVETTDRVVTDSPIYKNSWFAATLEPMMRAYWMHRLGRPVDANRWAREVEAQDWSLAAVEWLQRRSREGDKRSDDAVQSTGSASEAVPHVADADRPVGR